MSLIKQTETKKVYIINKKFNNDEVSNDLIIYCY